jgi:hypothetical protein
MPVKRTHKRTIKDNTESESTTKKIIVKSHIRSVRPNTIKKNIEPAINMPSVEKHIEKPTIKRQRKAIHSAVNISDSIKDIGKNIDKDVHENLAIEEPLTKPKRQSRKEKSMETTVSKEESAIINESVKESPFPIHSISKLVLSAIIWTLNGKGNLSMEFKLGNLTFTVDEILHHSSGIIDGVDKRLYSKYEHINKPVGVYSNEAFNFLAKNLKSVIGTTYKRALNEFNSRLGTHFTSNDIAEEIGANDLSGTTEDLNRLGESIRLNYDWYANGTVKRPGRGVDIITPAGISILSSHEDNGDGIKLTVTKKKVIIDRGNSAQLIDQKYVVQQRVPKTKFALNIDNKRVTESVMSQPLNIPFESVDKPDTLTEINGEYWRLVKTVGKTKYYQSPIVNSRKPFLVVSE